jgi:hypothetical protein
VSVQDFPSFRPALLPASSNPANTRKSAHPNRKSQVRGLAHEVTSELQPCMNMEFDRQRICQATRRWTPDAEDIPLFPVAVFEAKQESRL